MPYILIVVVVIFIRTFLATPVRVDGESMVPTLQDGDILILKKYDHSFKRFDIVVLDYQGEKLVKRVIGLPGEKVSYQNQTLYINGKKVKENFKHEKTEDFEVEGKIPKGYYFVLGDNRMNSKDSRMIGAVSQKQMDGTTNLIIFPFSNFGFVK